MMKSKIILTLFLFFSITDASALSCYKQSPNLVGMGDKYYNVDVVLELTRGQQKEVEGFARVIDGDWVGALSETECKGPDRKPTKETNEGSSKVRVSTLSSGEIVLNISNEYADEKLSKRKRRKTLEFTLLGNRATGYQISEGVLSTSNKFRRTRIISPGKYVIVGGVKKYIPPVIRSQFIERTVDIEILDEGLKISIKHYSNGVFVFLQQLQLSRS